MKLIKNSLVTTFITFAFAFNINAQSLDAKFDEILLTQYKPNGPGAVALVAKNGKTIYRKAFGKANLELDVMMKPENVFELGSITKQFTAVSILMLEEQGKLSTNDEITKYIPDYPTHGKKITIHQLLTHTSGIKSYTELPSFMKIARTDMTPTELINVFKNEPMDFDPGTQWHYNNSGYIILGYIIEKASGKSYASFIEENIFKKLGMAHSYYGSMSTIIPNRATGYQPTKTGFENADYLSLTLPYAAGSLMSTVDDMLLWSQAIHNNILITKESKQKAFTNYTINKGEPIIYGYGWEPNEINGRPSIEHGGGIFGYSTMGIYLPGENVYVIVLTNSSAGGPGDAALKMATIMLPKATELKPVSLTPQQLAQWVGTYEYEGNILRSVTLENGEMYSQREGGSKIKLIPTSAATFNFTGITSQYEFAGDKGKRTVILKDRIRRSKGAETTRKATEEKAPVILDAASIQQYVGSYELQPGFEIEVTADGNHLFAQATGQSKFEIFEEKPGTFYLKVVKASIDFNKDSNGKMKSLTLHQNGKDTEGLKIK
ncbi:MAG: serine hydrolase [Ferruginibacter sp.]